MIDLYTIGSAIGIFINLIVGTYWSLVVWDRRKNSEDLVLPILITIATSLAALALSWIWIGCTIVIGGTIYVYYYKRKPS